MATSLPAQALRLDLGPAIASAGLALTNPDEIIAELADAIAGAPARAVAKRRAEYLAGRWAAREALAALGIDAIPGRNEDGSPCWPSRVTGSITHGGGRALCAVARLSDVRSLGLDSEYLMGPSTGPDLLAHICSSDEQALLGRAFARPLHHSVTFAFSAKESLYKCLSPLVRRFMGFEAARVVAALGEPSASGWEGELQLELTVDWSEDFCAGQRFRARFYSSPEHVESAVILPA